MHYQYRWQYAITLYFSALTLFILMDIQPLRHQYHELLHVQDALEQQQHVSPLQHQTSKDSSSTLLRVEQQLVQLIQRANARLLSMNNELGVYNMLIIAEYKHINALLLYFLQHHDQFLISEFTLKPDENNLISLSIRLEVLRFVDISRQQIASLATQFAFCFADKAILPVDSGEKVFTAKQAHPIGSMEDSKGRSVLLRWPNGKIVVHRINEVIGSDGVLIQSIDASGVRLQFANKKTEFRSYQK